MFFRKDIDVSSLPANMDCSLLMEALLLTHEVKSKTYIASMLKYWSFMLTNWVLFPFAIIGILITEGTDCLKTRRRELVYAVILIFVIPFLIAWFAFTHIEKEW